MDSSMYEPAPAPTRDISTGDQVRVRLDPDCDGGDSPHFPAEDGAEGKVTVYQPSCDHQLAGKRVEIVLRKAVVAVSDDARTIQQKDRPGTASWSTQAPTTHCGWHTRSTPSPTWSGRIGFPTSSSTAECWS